MDRDRKEDHRGTEAQRPQGIDKPCSPPEWARAEYWLSALCASVPLWYRTQNRSENPKYGTTDPKPLAISLLYTSAASAASFRWMKRPPKL